MAAGTMLWTRTYRFLSKLNLYRTLISPKRTTLCDIHANQLNKSIADPTKPWLSPLCTLFFNQSNRNLPSPSKLSNMSSNNKNVPGRNFSEGSGSHPPFGNRPLKLMDFPEIIWPNPMKTLRNLFFSFLIRGYYDPEYSRDTFLEGAQQAIYHISELISSGDFDGLEGLVSREAIREIRQNYKSLSAKQRQFLAVEPKDVFFRFVYEIGMIFNDETDQRFVEIMVVFQGIHGFSELQQDSDMATFSQQVEDSQEKTYVCNYRFVREYTKGKEDSWTVNLLNHFSPKEIVANSDIFRR